MSSVSLKKLAIRGAAWTILGYGTSQILRLGGNLVLTRLLVPELFGLMALVQVFITGLALFSDIGIRPSIIQNKRGDDPDFLNTAWTIQVIRGFGLWFGCLLIAWPVAKFYGEPRLLWLIPIVGLNTIISGFNSTSLASLSRHMEVGKLIRFELGIQIISLSVLIAWAWLSPTIWALVGGNLVSIFIKVLWSHRLNPGTFNRFALDKDAIQDLFSFGRWIFLATITTFLASQADRLILGKQLSLEILGIYTIAFTIANIPLSVGKRLSNKVLFPAISQTINLPRSKLRAKILKTRFQFLMGLGLFLTALFSFGDLLILNLYDENYAQAAWMLPILIIGIWPRVLTQTISPSLLALGKPFYAACGNFLKFCYMIILLPLGISYMGILGAVIVVAFNDLPFYGAISYGLWREKLSCIWQDILATSLLIGLIALVLTMRYLVGFGFPLAGIL